MLFLVMLIVLVGGLFLSFKRRKSKAALFAILVFMIVIILFLLTTIVGMHTAVRQYETAKNSEETFVERSKKIEELEGLIESKMQDEPEYAEKLKEYLNEELQKNEEDEKRFEFQQKKEKVYRIFIWPLLAD